MLVAVVAVAGCIISQEDAANRACTSDTDCPQAYACMELGAQRTCELLYPPSLPADAGPADAGPGDAGPGDGGSGDGGVVPTYCEVRTLLNANCVSSCHGAVSTGSGRTDFRLDYYEPPAGGVRGAKAMADRIKVRTFDIRNMPPAGNPAPTDAERGVMARWVTGGALPCPEGGGADAGVN
ncbi:hypothetical protein POL68_02545 [Stigmatella sp. ncwal1]|uniref:Lipoprotein n=1 Tax=Stigmatella ashevillensis TaxID=2995309 RepID=A0ABT5D102_9BACT|nr:hypothetical protein [Stigmatella ashevillena]MDC0707339.1 hypothetical protein [Stigmatella ashevillena]